LLNTRTQRSGASTAPQKPRGAADVQCAEGEVVEHVGLQWPVDEGDAAGWVRSRETFGVRNERLAAVKAAVASAVASACACFTVKTTCP
jgi:hypothetical protein